VQSCERRGFGGEIGCVDVLETEFFEGSGDKSENYDVSLVLSWLDHGVTTPTGGSLELLPILPLLVQLSFFSVSRFATVQFCRYSNRSSSFTFPLLRLQSSHCYSFLYLTLCIALWDSGINT
jgi:hypothetical protein